MSPPPLRIVVIGAGHMGALHARKLHTLSQKRAGCSTEKRWSAV